MEKEVILVFVLVFIKEAQLQENLSKKNATAAQSSTYTQGGFYPANRAIDSSNETCSITGNQRTVVWWMLSFVDLMYISHVLINYRPGYSHRLAGYSLYVTNSTISASATGQPEDGYLCYKHTGSTLPDILQNVTCDMLGRHVIIYNERKSGVTYPSSYDPWAYLELCDVQVMGCPKGLFGPDCLIECPANCLDRHCLPSNGICIWGCIINTCPNSTCNDLDGTCGNGCYREWTGLYCNETNGNWGAWLEWNACTTFGDGTRSRIRSCDNPPPSSGGEDCIGNNTDYDVCSLNICQEKQNSPVVPVVVGSVLGILLIAVISIVVILCVFLRRKTHGQDKERGYESYDNNNQEKDQAYNSTPNIYVDEDICMEEHVTKSSVVQIQSLTEYLLSPYTSSNLGERLNNTIEHCMRLEAEIKYLSQTELGSWEKEDNIHTDYRTFGTTLFKEMKLTSYSTIVQIAPQRDSENFWKLVTANNFTKIFLHLDRNEKVTEFLPIIDESLKYDGLTVELESTDKLETYADFSVVKVKQSENQDARIIEVYKTITNERLSPHIACTIIDKIANTVDDRLLFVYGKSIPITNISTLAVCYNGIRKIKMDEPFNLLLDAKSVKTQNPDWFNEKEDLQYCYEVLREYLVSVHTYDIIQ